MRGMAAAVFGDEIDRKAALDRMSLLHAVQDQIMCTAQGGILDVRDAVLTTIKRNGETLATLITTSAKFEELGGVAHVEAVTAKFGGTYEIIDGRHYTAAGTLRKAERVRRALAASSPESSPE